MPHKKHKAKKKSKNNIIVKDENVITKIETTNNTEKIEEVKQIEDNNENKDMVYLYGLMERYIKVTGKTENKKEKDNFIFLRIKNGKKVFGKKEKELNGLKMMKMKEKIDQIQAKETELNVQ